MRAVACRRNDDAPPARHLCLPVRPDGAPGAVGHHVGAQKREGAVHVGGQASVGAVAGADVHAAKEAQQALHALVEDGVVARNDDSLRLHVRWQRWQDLHVLIPRQGTAGGGGAAGIATARHPHATLHRQAELKDGAWPQQVVVAHVQHAAKQVGRPAADGQPEAKAPVLCGVAVVATLEVLKHLELELVGDAHAGVHHLKHDLGVRGGVPRPGRSWLPTPKFLPVPALANLLFTFPRWQQGPQLHPVGDVRKLQLVTVSGSWAVHHAPRARRRAQPQPGVLALAKGYHAPAAEGAQHDMPAFGVLDRVLHQAA
mmetsp:Transcript_8097/g.20665  ORF Transcript_8097/g.20665 Transcript_8097/m.20665 type:complete len:314 (-) Transcript_8097:431-1372(-)